MMDYHLHSNFSHDCKVPLKDVITKAHKEGLENIIITDHYDCINGNSHISGHPFNSFRIKDLELYKNTINSYGLPLGIELGWDAKCPIDIDLKDFDFIILSVHYWQEQVQSDDPDISVNYDLYLDLLYEVALKNDAFTVLGHFDFPRRYHRDKKAFPKETYIKIGQILKTVIGKGKGIELNLQGLRDYGEPNPDINILKIYKALGGKIITVGSDSHSLDTIGNYSKEAIDILKSLDFEYVYLMKNGKWTFEKI